MVYPEHHRKRNVRFLEMGPRKSIIKPTSTAPMRPDHGRGTVTSDYNIPKKPVPATNPVPVWPANSVRWQSQYDVYICHSREEADCSYAMEMLSYLEQQPEKLRCFLPMRDMLAGSPIPSEMCSGLENSHCWVMLLTPHFLSDNWCKYQMHQFLAQAPCSNGRLIPIVFGLTLAQCPPEIKHMYVIRGTLSDKTVLIKVKGAIVTYLKEMRTVTSDQIPTHSQNSSTPESSQSTSKTVGNSQVESSVTQESPHDRSTRSSVSQEPTSDLSSRRPVTQETTSDMSVRIPVTQKSTNEVLFKNVEPQETPIYTSLISSVTQVISGMSSRRSVTQETTSDMSSRRPVTQETTSDMSSRRSVTQETTSDMSSRRPVTQETTSDLSSGSSVTQETTSDMSSRRPVPQETTSDLSSRRPVPQETTSDLSSIRPVPQETTSDLSSRRPVTQETTSDLSSRRPVTQETTSDLSSRRPVTQETTSDLSSRRPVTQETTSDLSSRRPVTQETTCDLSSGDSVTQENNTEVSLRSSVSEELTSGMFIRNSVTDPEATSDMSMISSMTGLKAMSISRSMTTSDMPMSSAVTQQETASNTSKSRLETPYSLQDKYNPLSLSLPLINTKNVCTDCKCIMTATKDSFSQENRVDTNDSGVGSMTKDHLTDCSDLYTGCVDALRTEGLPSTGSEH